MFSKHFGLIRFFATVVLRDLCYVYTMHSLNISHVVYFHDRKFLVLLSLFSICLFQWNWWWSVNMKCRCPQLFEFRIWNRVFINQYRNKGKKEVDMAKIWVYILRGLECRIYFRFIESATEKSTNPKNLGPSYKLCPLKLLIWVNFS